MVGLVVTGLDVAGLAVTGLDVMGLNVMGFLVTGFNEIGARVEPAATGASVSTALTGPLVAGA